MGLSISKQLIDLCGEVTIAHTLKAFENCAVIDEIVVVCREIDMESIKEVTKRFSKVKAVVTGGETRADSVKNGVRACSEESQFFAIHDGARPLVTPDDIEKVVKRAFVTKAATLGTAVTDTIKVVGSDNVISSTPDRATLFAVQTPQVFERELYQRAIDNAVLNNLFVTDDCSMVEALGEKVEIVLGSYENIKLTTVTDLSFARAIIENRKA